MPAPIIALVLGALELATKVIPIIRGMHLGGTVSIEDQAKVRAAYDKLRAAGDTAFSGPEWQIQPDPPAPIQ